MPSAAVRDEGALQMRPAPRGYSSARVLRPHFLFSFRKGNGVELPKEKRAWGNLPNGFTTPLLTAKGLAHGCCGVWNLWMYNRKRATNGCPYVHQRKCDRIRRGGHCPPDNPSGAARQPPLHKGAFIRCGGDRRTGSSAPTECRAKNRATIGRPVMFMQLSAFHGRSRGSSSTYDNR